jgi:Flp pilus assembly protein TadB
MNGVLLSSIAAALLFVAYSFLRVFSRRQKSRSRVDELLSHIETEASPEPLPWAEGTRLLESMNDRLGRAGYLSAADRKRAKVLAAAAVGGSGVCAALSGLWISGASAALIAGFCGIYLGLTAFLYYLRFRERDVERELLFQMPLFLESVILLVEAGLGILPAIERVVKAKETANQANAISQLFALVHRLSSHGMPLSQALELVADGTPHRIVRHILLHIDISGSEGGELIPSLRSLSDHAHSEWRLSVEHRVKRLENAVVFPVFASVIGLMFLTAAVPLVPLLSLKDSLEQRKHILPAAAHADNPVTNISPEQGGWK